MRDFYRSVALLRARIAERMHSTITRQILASLRHAGDDVEVIPHNAEKRLLRSRLDL